MDLAHWCRDVLGVTDDCEAIVCARWLDELERIARRPLPDSCVDDVVRAYEAKLTPAQAFVSTVLLGCWR